MKNPIGIGDASSNDTNLRTDWRLARDRGCQFGIVRATTTGVWKDGHPIIIQDNIFLFNADRMAEAGIKRMSYAWFDPRYKVCSPIDQAHKYLEVVNKVNGPGDLGPMIDIEDAPAAGIYSYVGVGRWIKAWLDEIELEYKVKPRIYTNQTYVCNYLFNSCVKETWLADYGLIIANWGVAAPWVPQPWAPTGWDAWQYRADAPGDYYGFHASIAGRPGPNICLAVWNGELNG